MNPLVHVIAGTPIIIVSFKYLSPDEMAAFFSTNVFLDIDHYFYYVFKFKDLNFQKAYKFMENGKNIPKVAFCALHTVEFLLLLILIAYIIRSKIIYALLGGVILHLLIDIFQGVYCRRMNYRWWSTFQYLRSLKL